jgi:hypothetical protein
VAACEPSFASAAAVGLRTKHLQKSRLVLLRQ